MKILLLSPLPPPAGGIATWTKRMLKLGLPNGWEIEHVNTKLIGGREVFNNTRKSILSEVKRTYKILSKIRIKLKDENIKIVHTNIPCSIPGMLREIINAIYVKFNKRKFVLHCRCTVPNMIDNKLALILYKLLASLCDGIIVLNKKSYNFTCMHVNTKTVIIPNFIEKDLELNDFERVINKSIKNVIYVGGVIEEKGCKVILEAAKELKELNFILVGRISDNIKKFDVPCNVILLGEKGNDVVKEKLYESDIFIFPSYFKAEGFSNALVEAMASGLPCVATDWAANEDMIEDKGGIIIPVREAKSLVNAINKMKDMQLRKKMSEWNIEKVKNYYTDDSVLLQYVNLYNSIV